MVHDIDGDMYLIGYIREDEGMIVFTNPEGEEYTITFKEGQLIALVGITTVTLIQYVDCLTIRENREVFCFIYKKTLYIICFINLVAYLCIVKTENYYYY